MGENKKYDTEKIIKTFFMESCEMLDAMESCLLSLEKNMIDSETLNALFRSVHSIKGSSGMFNFDEIESFTHRVETILDSVRKGNLVIDANLIGILLESKDYISILLDEYEKDNSAVIDETVKAVGAGLLEKMRNYGILAQTSAGSTAEGIPADIGTDSSERVSSECWHISLRFGKEVLRRGLDPQSFISYLSEKGKIKYILTVDDELPPIEEMDPESCYLGVEIIFDSDMQRKDIVEVFEFMKDDCDIRILPPRSTIAEYVKLINELPETPMRIGEILIQTGSLTEKELKTALSIQVTELSKNEPGAKEKQSLIGEILIDEKIVHKPVLDAALEKQKDNIKIEEKKSKSIRIDAEKLDDLINIVGELVITSASVRQTAEQSGIPEIVQPVLTLSRLVEDVRDRVMNIRMVQIGDTFKRFERVVRDLSRERGKEADLVISGGDTELDKTIVEKINDPIMHLIRNSVDHGIGTPDERIKNGKSGRGTIKLNAYHETGSIVIEVRDDGKGLNREKIYNKAVELGMIQPNQSITDNELFQVIFEPGFSTAEKVTNVSGRGVGMDVVKKNIEFLRGTVVLESEEGVGTVTRIHLPLTLAIIDGFLVQVAGAYYVLPLDMVSEVFEVSREELKKKEGANIINLRNEVLPFMRLRDFFEIPDYETRVENVIVVDYARKKAGIVVDRLIGEFQTVIKSLGKLFTELKWVSGATILGTGEVALILDVPQLIQNCQVMEASQRQTIQ